MGTAAMHSRMSAAQRAKSQLALKFHCSSSVPGTNAQVLRTSLQSRVVDTGPRQ